MVRYRPFWVVIYQRPCTFLKSRKIYFEKIRRGWERARWIDLRIRDGTFALGFGIRKFLRGFPSIIRGVFTRVRQKSGQKLVAFAIESKSQAGVFYQTVQTCANQDGWVAGPWGVVWVTGGVSGWRLRGNGPSGDDRHALVARTRQNLDHGVVGLRVERLGEPKRTHQTTRTSRANGVFWPCGSRDIRGHFSVSAVERPNASERGQSPRASGIARTRGRHLLDVTQISSRFAGHAPSHRSLSHLSRTVVFRSHPPDRRPPISIFWLGAWWSGGRRGGRTPPSKISPKKLR